MSLIGIIGGTGLYQLEGFSLKEQVWAETPFGEPSSMLSFSNYAGRDVVFLARHGNPHRIAPHLINYRANLFALKESGVQAIIAINAVGGIHPELGPQAIAIPDQIIDYTYGRDATLFDGCHIESVEHVDFSYPYDAGIRAKLLEASRLCNLKVLDGGTYGATQGPRLETAAEIQRMKRDGCDMVGMTGMPEAIIARELSVPFASLALSVNWAAGLSDNLITQEDIASAVEQGMSKVHQILTRFVTLDQ